MALKEYLLKKKGQYKKPVQESSLSKYLREAGLKKDSEKKIKEAENQSKKNLDDPKEKFEKIEEVKELTDSEASKLAQIENLLKTLVDKVNVLEQSSSIREETIEDEDEDNERSINKEIQKKNIRDSQEIPDYESIFKKLKIPQQNQEPFINMVRGQGIDVDSPVDEQELLGIFQEALEKYPIFTRSTQYNSVRNTEPNKRAAKQDLTNLSLAERAEIFAEKLEKLG